MESPLSARRIIAAQAFALLVCFIPISQAQDHDLIPPELRPWLESPQAWQRDTDGPIISLGKKGSFDDEHLFAPMVALENGQYTLWHCGSTGAVKERVFKLGMSTSSDGRQFTLDARSPVYSFGDGIKSVLTPTLLRNPDGSTLREDGKLRMWFSSASNEDKFVRHTLHDATSADGVTWSKPSPVLLEGVYAPSILKIGEWYQMWYTDVSGNPWVIRQASSKDGRKWRVYPDPVIQLDQKWEKENQFYPTVVKIDDAYLMWYGSYWTERADTTALGLAVSLDGLKWYKHPQNPVYRPDPKRPWESNYTTSQSIMRLPDGSLRLWYASRKKPPFLNKYFAINTAVWKKSALPESETNPVASIPKDPAAFRKWQNETRGKLRKILGIPDKRVPLNAEKRGQLEWDGIIIEKWVFTSEKGSRVPAVLYRPKNPPAKMPAVVFTNGHGGSKSAWGYNFSGQLYARMGLAVLALDPIGEEERHKDGKLGTRAHDPKSVSDRADKAGRLVMGKLIFDTMRGIDFLLERDDIDHDKIGVAGSSLGGAKAGWMAAIEPRIKMSIVSGWAFQNIALRTKYCTSLPNQRMREILTWAEYLALAAPDCAIKIMNGDADWVIDRENDQSAWAGMDKSVDQAARIYKQFGAPDKIESWYEANGGHRLYIAYKEALEWTHRHLGTPAMTLEQIRALPTLNSGDFCDKNGIKLESMYRTSLHHGGATLPDIGLRLTPREKLSCLKPGELGSDDFTVEGWLKQIEKNQNSLGTLSEKEQNLGFTQLNDGTSFEGWQQDGNWEVQNGAFYRARKGGSLTYTEKTVPDDFELRFEWKVSKGCNSGVYYRPSQYEYQVLDNVNSPYGENPRQAAASLFFCMAPSKDASKPFGEWNTGRVLGKGTVIQHWLNGEKVIDFDYTDPKWAKEVELLRIRGADLAARGGKVWLQDHGQPVWFRNLRMRSIPKNESLIADPDFKPMPIPPAALKKEQARVRSMLEKAKASK